MARRKWIAMAAIAAAASEPLQTIGPTRNNPGGRDKSILSAACMSDSLIVYSLSIQLDLDGVVFYYIQPASQPARQLASQLPHASTL